MLRLAVLQRVCPSYRVPLFQALSQARGIQMHLFIGADVPNSKVKSAASLGRIPFTQLPTRFVRLGSRVMPWHVGLGRALENFNPDVILCEGESHFLGYLQAFGYRARHSGVGLLHWCFIALPGAPNRRRDMASTVKSLSRRHFDAFVLYSSHSKNCLTELGVPPGRMFVATNVGQVSKFLAAASANTDSKATIRSRLGLPHRFTSLYVGTLDENKRPDLILDLARHCDSLRFNFVILGVGPLLERLRARVEAEGMRNVSLPGRVTEGIESYYLAADVLLLPGRGGIVMSEAMASGLPVIVHQADGTESDLVLNGRTGVRLSVGDVSEFRSTLEALQRDSQLLQRLGAASRELIRDHLNEQNMVRQIVLAAEYAQASRSFTLCGAAGASAPE